MLGDRLRRARQAQGLTLSQVGAALGVSHAAVSRWETGRRAPSLRLLQRLAAVLGVAPGALVDLDPSGPAEDGGGASLAHDADRSRPGSSFDDDRR